MPSPPIKNKNQIDPPHLAALSPRSRAAMSKRKREEHDHPNRPNIRKLKPPGTPSDDSLVNPDPETITPCRRSARLTELDINGSNDRGKNVSQLRSPSHDAKHNPDSKPPKVLPLTSASIELDTRGPVGYWASTQHWPPSFSKPERNMAAVSGKKRKSESKPTHPSDRLVSMQEHRIFLRASPLITEASRKDCIELLKGNREPIGYPYFPAARVHDVLARVDSANEARIQRDVMPCVVPSAENLHFCGVPGLDFIVEELSAPWTRCATIGSTCPKPDYAAGLSQEAFSRDELDLLRNYATFTTPFFFTPGLCFPFLICEAKSGDDGMNKAHRQNLHSAAIAVKAILELHYAAYGKSDRRVQELYGQALVFTVAHNHEIVHLYGHFARLVADTPDIPSFYRSHMGVFSLTEMTGEGLNKPQNFVQNVYENFAPEHLKRIKEAAKSLPQLGPRTSASFAASNLALRETTDSEEDNCQMEALMQELKQRERELEELKSSIKPLNEERGVAVLH